MYFCIYVLFNILTVCNNLSNSVRVFFCGLVQYDFVLFCNFSKTKVPDLAYGLGPCFGDFCCVSFFSHFNNCRYVLCINYSHNIFSKHFEALFHGVFNFPLIKINQGPRPWIRYPRPCINIWGFIPSMY